MLLFLAFFFNYKTELSGLLVIYLRHLTEFLNFVDRVHTTQLTETLGLVNRTFYKHKTECYKLHSILNTRLMIQVQTHSCPVFYIVTVLSQPLLSF